MTWYSSFAKLHIKSSCTLSPQNTMYR